MLKLFSVNVNRFRNKIPPRSVPTSKGGPVMKKFALFLSIYLLACLLAACAVSDNPSTPDDQETCGPGVPTLLTCRVVENWNGTLVLAKEGGGLGDVYTLAWEDSSIRSGDLVEITFSGSIQESFPMGVTEVTSLRVLDDGFDDRCALYLQVLEDLWEKDPALSENVSIIGLDLSQTSLTDAERAALAWHFSCLHDGVDYVFGDLEALIDWGYITGEPLGTEDAPSDAKFWHWEDGCLFSIVEQPVEGTYSLTPVTFDAMKWRSSLGAYYFSDCTSVQSSTGEWDDYAIGAEMIS